MDIAFNILLWIHLVALALGGAASFGLPVVGSKMATAPADARPVLGSIAKRLSTFGRAAVGTLIVTGPIMVWLRYGSYAGFTAWFWVKMVLVVLLLGLIIFAGLNAKRAQAGDMAAAKRAPMIGLASMLTFIAVVLSAVFAFN